MDTSIQKLLDIVSNAVNTVDVELKDGFQTSDLFGLIPIATAIPAIVSDKAAISSAWKNRTSENLAEWLAYMKTKITLQSADAEKKAEAILALAVAGVDVYDIFAAAKVPAPLPTPAP